MKRNSLYYVIVVLGIGLVLAGFGLLRFLFDDAGSMSVFPYLMIGLGCGIFGHGMGAILSGKAVEKHPEAARQLAIEVNDERNVSIGNSAKAKAYDMMVFSFGALMVSFALMNVDLVVILLFVFTYLVVVGYGIYYRLKLDKEM